ncbi:144R protein [Yaba-like disease virus]|uniref:Complement control protein C3 n=1 Tax=Yaba-like disease virus TaxID=132475 RepID=Q9DHG9_YLDV|nr:144R protein [Yaba-like disease virus]CAC21382.1 144R protein [Yaba-like disease virus]
MINLTKIIILLFISKTWCICVFNKNDAKYSNVDSYENKVYEENENLEYKCNNNFDKVFVTCNNGSWSTKNMCIGKNNCKDPVTILNGYIKDKKDQYSFGDLVTYACKVNKLEKYSIVGNATVKCINKQWMPKYPVCKLIRCKYPALQNGFLNVFEKKFYYGDIVNFKCKKGFILLGSSVSTCDINSIWYPGIPKCVKDKFNNIQPNYLFDDLDEDFNNSTTNYNTQQNIITIIILLSIICFIFVLGLIALFLSCNKSTLKPSIYNKF